MRRNVSPTFAPSFREAALKKRRTEKIIFRTGIAIAVIILLALVVPFIAGYHQTKQKDCTVTGKDRTSSLTSEGRSNVRIYTEDCGVFTIKDTLLHTRFNSADLYGRLKEGQRYHVKYYGWRISFFSQFPNLLDAQPVD